jgi:hypothetical protein
MTDGQMLGKGYRKAYASKGDDMRARFVRVDQGNAEHGRKRRQNRPRLPGFEAAFIQEGRTKFSKAVQAPTKDILVSGYNNIKIGKVVRVGPLAGYWIYTLSLEERKTCPSSCQHWQTCYGNNMPFAKRVDHTAPDFLEILETAVARWCNAGAGRGGVKRKGVLIRLHALGDFFSPGYVAFWWRMLEEHKNLCIYGYTAHKPGVPTPGFAGIIGSCIADMNKEFGSRSMIRFSNGGLPKMSTVSIGNPERCPPNAFVCPSRPASAAAATIAAPVGAQTRMLRFWSTEMDDPRNLPATVTDMQQPPRDLARLPMISAEQYQHVGRFAGALVLSCFEQMGGLPRMTTWADDNPTDFYTKLFPKLISRSQQVDVSGTLTIDDAITRLEKAEFADFEEIPRSYDL